MCPQSAPQFLEPQGGRLHLRHMLLFSSLSPEAAWQQAVFTAYLPTLPLPLPPPPPQVGATTPAPREPGAGGQATQMTSAPSPTRTRALLGTPQDLPGRK